MLLYLSDQRNVLLAFTLLVYFIKYIHEIININAEIVEYIFQVKEREKEQIIKSTRKIENDIASETECVEEEMFSAIYNPLFS